MGAILGTIASVAAMVGIQRLVDKYDRKQLQSQGINMAELSADLRQILNLAQAKGSSLLSKVTAKINNLPSFISGSDAIRNVLREQRKKLNGIANSIEETMSKEKGTLDSLSNQLTEISLDPDYLKDTDQIQRIRKDVKDTSSELTNKLNNIERKMKDV